MMGLGTLDSQIRFIQLYSKLMTDDGILIIEDVQAWDWIEALRASVPSELKPYIQNL